MEYQNDALNQIAAACRKIAQINWTNVKLNHSIYILKYVLPKAVQYFIRLYSIHLCHFSILLYGICFVQWHNPYVTHENEINVQLKMCINDFIFLCCRCLCCLRRRFYSSPDVFIYIFICYAYPHTQYRRKNQTKT